MLVVLGMLGVWGWSLIDVLQRPAHQWQAIGQDRSLWALAILFLGLPGSVGYLAIVRPKLARAGALPPVAAYPMLTAAPPGWYPDPQGMPVMRWFDGRQWTPQTAAMGSVPMGGVSPGHPSHGHPMAGPPVPMAAPPMGPPPGAPPHNYPYPPA